MRTNIDAKKTHQFSVKPTSETKKKAKLNPKRFAVAMIVIIFAVYFIYVMIWQQVMLSRKNKEIDALEEQITAATQQAEELEKELENLNDPEYLERIAREKLGLVRPNERVFVDVNQSEVNQRDN